MGRAAVRTVRPGRLRRQISAPTSPARAAGPVPEAPISNPAPRRSSPMATRRRARCRASDLPYSVGPTHRSIMKSLIARCYLRRGDCMRGIPSSISDTISSKLGRQAGSDIQQRRISLRASEGHRSRSITGRNSTPAPLVRGEARAAEPVLPLAGTTLWVAAAAADSTTRWTIATCHLDFQHEDLNRDPSQ